MARTGHGEDRYPTRRARALPPMVVDGADLGPAMAPQDLFVHLRQLLDLEDQEILDALQAGAGRMEADPEGTLVELSDADHALAIEQARAVTRSRVTAWRRRARHMTWLELRVLLLGLKDVLLAPK